MPLAASMLIALLVALSPWLRARSLREVMAT